MSKILRHFVRTRFYGWLKNLAVCIINGKDEYLYDKNILNFLLYWRTYAKFVRRFFEIIYTGNLCSIMRFSCPMREILCSGGIKCKGETVENEGFQSVWYLGLNYWEMI